MIPSATGRLIDAAALRHFIADRFGVAAAAGATAGDLRLRLLGEIDAAANRMIAEALAEMERAGTIVVTRRHAMGNRWALAEHGKAAPKPSGAPKAKKARKPPVYDRVSDLPPAEPEPPRRHAPRLSVPRSGLNLAPDLAPVGDLSTSTTGKGA